MNRKEQIKAAVKQLDGRGHAEVAAALDTIAKHERERQRTTQKTKGKLRIIRTAMEKAGKAARDLPPGMLDVDFAALQGTCERLIAEKAGARDAKKRDAAQEALRLLEHFGYPATTTRHGRWWWLAAVLFGYGHSVPDLYHQCVEIKKKRKAGTRA